MRIAILYICTGRYTVFWEHFFTSCEQHFLKNHEKHYYVFTDGKICHTNCPRVHRIEQENLGWPDATLKRFHMFERISDILEKESDFVVFFNANMVFLRDIGEEFLPSHTEELVFYKHPGLYNHPAWLLPYERRKESTAYIPYGQGSIYVCGGVNGGFTTPYLKFITTLRENIDADLKKGIIARWHDESHINHYILGKKYKIGHPGYVYPDRRNLPFPRIIRVIDKASVGGHAYLRGQIEQNAQQAPKNFFQRCRTLIKRPCIPKTTKESPMVLARIMGGLGNQMFIYAAALSLATRLGAELHLDMGKLSGDRLRQYALPHFGIDAPLWHIPRGGDRFVQAWQELRHLLSYIGFPTSMRTLRSDFPLDKRFFDISGSTYLIGYWQSPRYWQGYEDKVREIFNLARFERPELRETLQQVTKPESVAVHLRLGDFTSPQNRGMYLSLDKQYYDRAYQLLQDLNPQRHFYIFSDEPDKAKQLFSHWRNTTFQPRRSQEEDMMLMSRCSSSIIANSSFSWWAAWLGSPKKQRIIAPRMWFTRETLLHTYTLDLFPDDWILL